MVLSLRRSHGCIARTSLFAVFALAVGCSFGPGTVLGEEPSTIDPVVPIPVPTDAPVIQDPEPLPDAGAFTDRGGVTTDAARVDATTMFPRDPCMTLMDGSYCAGLLGLPSGGLLRCRGSVMQGLDPCPNGCFDRTGATDACLSDAVEPCYNETDGNYCGASIGSTTRPNDLYLCRARRTSRIDTCASGCNNLAGGTDVCR